MPTIPRTIPLWAIAILLLIATGTVHADDSEVTTPGGPAAVDETHPIYSADARWVGGMLAAVGGLFLAALVIGRLVRDENPESESLMIEHEEQPAVAAAPDPSSVSSPHD
jgi:hypothetical protein